MENGNTTQRLFEWDYEKEQRNIKIHKISFETAKFVFNDNNRIELFDINHSGTEDRIITIGKVDKVLFVVYTERGDKTRIISARTATKAERRLYGNSYIGFTR
ncbi:BrnT family toxin [Treponema denticola]|uniref:BrnT family toxin n=1 Tax=Treponema denticola TaxID=158 RepID=UPI0020A5B122|nr:BrnT family toxin [Treponema denticola]UTD07138.1 BrnT family toxin [Treponema denticola]